MDTIATSNIYPQPNIPTPVKAAQVRSNHARSRRKGSSDVNVSRSCLDTTSICNEERSEPSMSFEKSGSPPNASDLTLENPTMTGTRRRLNGSRCHTRLLNRRMTRFFHIAFTFSLLLSFISEALAMSDEKRLIKFLLENYERVGIVGRPVFNTSETVRVNYGLALIQILDLDEKNQVLTTNVWSRYAWKDILLQWDPNDYGGVNEIRVPIKYIWRPDIVLYNYADERLAEQRDALAVVSSGGEVMWIPMSIYKSTCSIDITNFPFDEQICEMKFGSWTYDGFKLDLHFYQNESQININDYTISNEWSLLEHPAKRNVNIYPCCIEPYLDLTFTMKVKRMGAFYSYILVLPCVLLSTISLVVFWLPPDSSAKMILGINNFLAFFFLLRILADCTPPGSTHVPLIGAYFCLNLILITFSSFLTVIVINFHFQRDKLQPIPSWVRKIFLEGLSRLFFMHHDFPYDKKRGNKPTILKPKTEEHTLITHIHGRKKSREKRRIKSPVLTYNKWEPPPAIPISGRNSPIMGTRFHNHSPTRDTPTSLALLLENEAIENEVKEIRRAMRSYLQRALQKDANNRIAREWRMAALILDRLFFFMYLATIIVALFTVFPKS